MKKYTAVQSADLPDGLETIADKIGANSSEHEEGEGKIDIDWIDTHIEMINEFLDEPYDESDEQDIIIHTEAEEDLASAKKLKEFMEKEAIDWVYCYWSPSDEEDEE